MASIDRTRFGSDPRGPGLKGSFMISGRRYDGLFETWTGDMEQTWANAERIVSFLESKFIDIESMVRIDLVPDLAIWLDEDDHANAAEVERRVLDAMRATNPVGFVIYDAGASTILFDGPDFVEGHSVQVQFDEKGQLVSVGLAG